MDKCLNDLFGVRVIYDSEVDYKTIKKFVKEKFPNNKLKCLERIVKDENNNVVYKAVHIYFKEDNYNFSWELQIWSKENESLNKNSHEKYKQGYTIWENTSKGGAV